MTTMTIDQAKDHLAEPLAKAADGEEVVIVRDDGAAFTVASAMAVQDSPKPTGKRGGFVGSMEEEIWMADDFDEIPEGKVSVAWTAQATGAIPFTPVGRFFIRGMLQGLMKDSPAISETFSVGALAGSLYAAPMAGMPDWLA